MKHAIVKRECKVHGLTDYARYSGKHTCKKCNVDRVTRRRREAKEIIVKEHGGKCRCCGYDRCSAGLVFHHLDPSEKDFGLSERGLTKSLAKIRLEADKCVLLCQNCHTEVHAGIRVVA